MTEEELQKKLKEMIAKAQDFIPRYKMAVPPEPEVQDGLEYISYLLVKDLAGLPQHKIAAFGASCSERMVNYYDEFTKEAEWGDFIFIRSTLDLIWDFLLGEQGTKEKLQAAQSKLDELVPHSDDFGIEAIFAQDACVCIGVTIDLCLGVWHSAAVIVDYAFGPISNGRCLAITGDIWQFGSGPEEVEFDKAVLEDPFVKKEITLQREDLALLKSQEDLNQDIILTLRNKAQQNQWKASDILNTPGVFEFPILKSFIEGPNRSE